MVHYLDTKELLMDLLEELSFPANTRRVLNDIGPLRIGVENLVDVFKTRRLDTTRLCGCDTAALLYKYCKHRTNAVCMLPSDDCKFKYPRKTPLEKERKVIWPCPECGGEAWHDQDCKGEPGKHF